MLISPLFAVASPSPGCYVSPGSASMSRVNGGSGDGAVVRAWGHGTRGKMWLWQSPVKEWGAGTGWAWEVGEGARTPGAAVELGGRRAEGIAWFLPYGQRDTLTSAAGDGPDGLARGVPSPSLLLPTLAHPLPCRGNLNISCLAGGPRAASWG